MLVSYQMDILKESINVILVIIVTYDVFSKFNAPFSEVSQVAYHNRASVVYQISPQTTANTIGVN